MRLRRWKSRYSGPRLEPHARRGSSEAAVEEMLRLVDGSRIVAGERHLSYFSGGIETEEQLDQALVWPEGSDA